VETGRRLTKGPAIAGSLLLWTAFALMLVSAVVSVPRDVTSFELLTAGAMDLSPLVLVGGCVAMLAAVRARSRRLPIGCGLAAVCASLVAGMLWRPSIPAAGWPSALAMTLIAAYWLGALAVGVAVASLARALVSRPPESSPSTTRG
jgi:peptidoglycan/LPS O-acetylase OafA/YrhL